MMPNEDNSLQEPRDTLGRAHGFANMTILCAREQIRIVEEPDVGTIPHFLSWVGGLLLHGTYCVEGFSWPQRCCPLPEQLLSVSKSSRNAVPHDTSDSQYHAPSGQKTRPSQSHTIISSLLFSFLCQRLNHNSISAGLARCRPAHGYRLCAVFQDSCYQSQFWQVVDPRLNDSSGPRLRG